MTPTAPLMYAGQGALPAVDAAGHPATADALTFAGMSYDSPMRPEPGPRIPQPATADSGPWSDLTDLLDTVPGWIWAAAVGALLLLTFVTLPVARRFAFRAGRHAAGHATPTADRRDRLYLLAALTPASLFWVAVIVGSARGLVGFGRDTLRWRDGWDLLVPFTLDGIAVAFGILAFRALRKGHNPDRSIRVAGAAMLASAGINYFHEARLADGSPLGGAYLALMSVLGMLIFHELLAQFQDGAERVNRSRPKFGLRWFTYTPNTLCAALAWINHPPAADTAATVANAVAHLEQVRADKRARRAARITPTPTVWERVWAPARAAALDAALAAEAAERSEMAERLDAVAAEFRAAEQRAERASEHAAVVALEAAEQVAAAQAERQAERARAYEAERRAGALAEQVAALKAERRQSAPKNGRRKAAEQPEQDPGQKAGAPVLTDAEAVAVLLSEHPEHDYAWTSRRVRELTGAGFGRIPKLLALVAERHGRSNGSSPAEQSA